MTSLPFGYRFMPSNEEVIKYYLLRHAMGFPMPANRHIVEKPLYGENAEPRQVLGDVDDSHWDILEGKGSKDRVIYVLTKLSKIHNRIARRAGNGTWSGQTGGKDIRDGSGELIGSLKMFSFEGPKKRDDDVHWIMHEYSLAGNNINLKKRKEEEYVICKIRRTSKRKEFGQQDLDDAPSYKKHIKATAATAAAPIISSNTTTNNHAAAVALIAGSVVSDHPLLINNPQLHVVGFNEECTPVLAPAEESNNKNQSVFSNEDRIQPWAAEDHHNVINLDDDDDLACPNEAADHVVVVGVSKDIIRSTRASPADSVADVINLDDDDDPTGLDGEDCIHVERPAEDSNHNVVVGVEDVVVSTLANSVSDPDNLMSLDDLEEPDDSILDGLEFNLDGLDLFFTERFME